MKKRILIPLLAILLMCLVVMPVAASPVALTAVGEAPREAQIVVLAPEGLTLGQLDSISWDEYLVNGYAPHVDIIIDADPGEGVTEDALVVEYAYNNATATREDDTATSVYGCKTGEWYTTFNDDGEEGDDAVTVDSNAWLTSGAPGPLGAEPVGAILYAEVDNNFVYGTIANWIAGGEVTEITGITRILRFEFEVDSWIMDTTAIIDNIEILTGGSSTGLTVTIGTPEPEPDILAISVAPTILDFGTVSPGGSGLASVEVSNAGTVIADVTTTLMDAEGTIFEGNLGIDPASFQIAVEASQTVDLTLTVPAEYLPTGPETATLIFEISAPGS